ncbi:hypothetical protein [Butyrivibrio sp. XBB1001]|uniref:hypothetical protein n=1 Tax=Butyrivibrio sp. XBB1001 TaxID=1280682 RepID=UPI00040156B0|nr:hypothetical protein [Butyrivibrio sp. XBB1001]
MARKIEELRNVIAASDRDSYELLLRRLRDKEDITVAGHLMELFYDGVPKHGIIGTIEDLANSMGVTSMADFNDYSVFYPSDRPLRERMDMPVWLYVCTGKKRLGDVMQEMLNSAHLIPRPRNRYERKTVILLTDKWSDRVFKGKELSFIRSACHYEINYYFIAASEYGLYQVPFLPSTFSESVVDDFRDDEIICEDGRPNVFM